MQQLILAKCISGVKIDSIDYGVGYGQASTDFYNAVKGTNNERTTCAVGYHTNSGAINSTNACYAGYYDQMLSLCYYSHTCNKYNPIKPIDYPPKVIPPLPPPPTENSTRLVYDSYYGAGTQNTTNTIVPRTLFLPLRCTVLKRGNDVFKVANLLAHENGTVRRRFWSLLS